MFPSNFCFICSSVATCYRPLSLGQDLSQFSFVIGLFPSQLFNPILLIDCYYKLSKSLL